MLVIFARIVGLCFFGGFMLFGLLPVPIFIGEVLPGFFFFFFLRLIVASGLVSLYSLLWRCPFGNKFLIIKKKKCIDLPNCHSLYLFLLYFQINRLKHTSPFFFLFYSEKKKRKKRKVLPNTK